MPYLVDGHNLIGVLPGLDLKDPDDEAKLVALLRAFCARERTTAAVYFDRGRPGEPLRASSGVSVHFVRPPDTADEAIARHLDRLGRQAPNWSVVSSDTAVARGARRAGARSVSSRAFAGRLSPRPATHTEAEKPAADFTSEELEAWEALFRRGPDAAGGH